MDKKISFSETLSVKDVQEYLNLSSTSAYRLFNDKDFPSFKVGGSKRVTAEDFSQWLQKQKNIKGGHSA